MGSIFRILLPIQLLRPLLRPLTRVVVGLIAIPLFRLVLRKVVRVQELDRELEKDLEAWFRGSLLLLIASANMEQVLFGWVPFDLQDQYAWLSVGLRLLLAIGVIEGMPDQALFSVIHPGPPKLKWSKERPLRNLREQIGPVCKGLVCQHLSRSSPVFAIMAAIFGGNSAIATERTAWLVGWVCYGLAITQYLIIGLVTSRDKALDVLSAFDRQVAVRRRDLIEEFEIEERSEPAHRPATPHGKRKTQSPGEVTSG